VSERKINNLKVRLAGEVAELEALRKIVAKAEELPAVWILRLLHQESYVAKLKEKLNQVENK